MRPVAFKWAKQTLEINHFLLMRKVLDSCVPARKGKQCRGGCVPGPCKYLGSPMVWREDLVHRPLGPSSHCIAFLGRVWLFFVCFFFFPPPAPPPMAAANAEPQCCWLLTSRGWWEKNLGHLHGQRGLGVQHGQRQNGVSGLSLTLLLTDE